MRRRFQSHPDILVHEHDEATDQQLLLFGGLKLTTVVQQRCDGSLQLRAAGAIETLDERGLLRAISDEPAKVDGFRLIQIPLLLHVVSSTFVRIPFPSPKQGILVV
jgi:hypothetical protein